MKKRTSFSVLSAAMMAFNTISPASAASLTSTFTKAGSVYGVQTECSSFSSYVTAHAQVSNDGISTHRSLRGYRAVTVTATRFCPSGSVEQSGWYQL
ncbi:MAG TPA: hypothetical protein DDX71_07765 [Ruminococcus sp.]|nr:hypothetical protein [Ruminococcus sp.]